MALLRIFVVRSNISDEIKVWRMKPEDRRASLDVAPDQRWQSPFADIWNDFCHNVAAVRQHPEHHSLVWHAAAALAAGRAAVNVRFVGFDLAARRPFLICVRHVLADQVAMRQAVG